MTATGLKPLNTAGVCLIVKDEARYMVEWIAHYLVLGFDEILVYDNGSSDGTFAMIESFGKRFAAVDVCRWPDVEGEIPQRTAYADALGRSDSEWLAFFDADELLVLKQHDCIQDFLARYPDGAGAVAINWLLFGSSSQKNYVDELQAVRFRMCARNAPGTKNRFVKSIARTSAAETAASHTVTLKPGFSYFDDTAFPADMLGDAKTAVASHSVAQLNHYVVRSLQEFREKRARGNVARSSDAADKFTRLDDEFWRTHSTNHVEDSAIDIWVERAAPFRRQLEACLAEDGISIG